MSLLGIDIGSGAVKAVAFSVSGEILAQATEPYLTRFPGDNRAEATPEDLWVAFTRACVAVGSATVGDPVEALAIASHGETFIPLAADGQPVGPAIMNADNRAVKESRELAKTVGYDALYKITGVPPHPMYALPKIVWLKRHEPTLYNRTRTFVTPAGYVQSRLGLQFVMDCSLAGRTSAFDLDAGGWSRTVLEAAGVAAEMFPEALPAETPLGQLSTSVAKAIGLPKGTLVVLGGHDQSCGAMGAGCLRDGDAADSAGTYECLSVVSRCRPDHLLAAPSHLNVCRHVVDGLYLTLAFFPAGVMTQWFVREFVPAEEQKRFHSDAQEQINRMGSAPTGICVLPHLIGACTPAWDPSATGVIVGLTPWTNRWHLYKALFEGFACELDLNIEAVERAVGTVGTVRIFGGNSRHAFSLRLRADITGKRFEALAHPEAVCLGAAMLAGIAAGKFPNADAASAMIGRVEPCEADPASSSAYETQKRKYRAIYPALYAVRAMKGESL